MTLRRQTLRRYEKIRKKAQYESIFALGQVVRSRAFDLFYDQVGQGRRQAGFVVSRKVATRATTRGRIKRRMREIFRRNKDRLAEGTHIIFRANPGVEELNFEQLENTFFQLSERIRSRTR
ncbi:MAG TPA: ribonuclease P protein component [bacterium]|nr:ribonuclease P protein component [bacterium]